MPIVYICPLGCFAYKSAPHRRYLESPSAPKLTHFTPLRNDTFVGVHCEACILWFNLPTVRDVAITPTKSVVRTNMLSVAEMDALTIRRP